jgi:hypothetical protein
VFAVLMHLTLTLDLVAGTVEYSHVEEAAAAADCDHVFLLEQKVYFEDQKEYPR